MRLVYTAPVIVINVEDTMILYVMRHAEAEEGSEFHPSDFSTHQQNFHVQEQLQIDFR